VPDGPMGSAPSGRGSARRYVGAAGQHVGVAFLALLAAVAARLPVGLTHRVARLVGTAWYMLAPRDRALARGNLSRVCAWLVATGRASPRARAAVRDPRALDHLVRDAFGHRARYYLEVLIAGRYDRDHLERHVALDDPALVDRVLADPGPLLVIGLHFGGLELPALYLTAVRGRRVVAPMETLTNAPLQAFLARSRAHSGVTIVPTRGSRADLERAVAAGDAIGLVADRDVTGPGVAIELFGAPARLPAGPGLFAAGHSIPAFVAGARRTGWGDYAALVVPLDAPPPGSHRDRVTAFLQQTARAFETIIADAPEQWWSVFLPIWGKAK